MRLLVDPPAVGAWNMALDEALMDSARAGAVTLRLYRWEPGCLSLGRNQLDAFPASGRTGVDVVRRPTGGRSVYHHRELTYSVTLPERAWGGPRATYARINAALGRGLAALGVPVDLATPEEFAGAGAAADARASAPAAPPASPSTTPAAPRACFADPAPGELLVGGRKLVGSAQWRHRGVLLQHGSLLLVDEQGRAAPQGAAQAVGGGSGAIGLLELLAAPPAPEQLVEALRRGFAAELGVPVEPGEATDEERAAARRLEAVYRSAEWTWRRRLPSALAAS